MALSREEKRTQSTRSAKTAPTAPSSRWSSGGRSSPNVRVGTLLEKHFDQVEISRLRSDQQGSISGVIGCLRVRPAVEQQVGSLGFPPGDSNEKNALTPYGIIWRKSRLNQLG